jgi:hypothetical protein
MYALFLFQPCGFKIGQGERLAGIPEKSIAVLPFESLSGQKETFTSRTESRMKSSRD